MLRHAIADAVHQLGKLLAAIEKLAAPSIFDEIAALSTSRTERSGVGEMRHPGHCPSQLLCECGIGLSERCIEEGLDRFHDATSATAASRNSSRPI
jgi:hypothetical protein